MSGPQLPDPVPPLYVARAAGPLTAGEAVAAAAALGAPCVGMLSSPTGYRMVRCDQGVLSTAEGPVTLGGVFAVRLFSPAAELRWVHDEGGRGTAVLVSETAAAPAGWSPRRVEAAAALDDRYALWGRRFLPHPDAPGWCRAMEGRIGYLDIPADPPGLRPAQAAQPGQPGQPGQPAQAAAQPGRPALWPAAYLELRVREYIGRDGHGNAFVCEERLLDIVPALPELGRPAEETRP